MEISPMNSHDVAPHMPEGLNVVASRHLEVADGKYPIAWVDEAGNVLPVEKYQLLSILPPGASYLFDMEELKSAIGQRRSQTIITTATDRETIGHATGESRPMPPTPPAINRGQVLSAFDSAEGKPTHKVR
jgi:hypothetical protein